jgi:hypothetical protein
LDDVARGSTPRVVRGYGLQKPMVERALIEVYQTVVLDQQR